MKQTKKEIEATLRNKIARQYKEKMDRMQERINTLATDYCELQKKYRDTREALSVAEDTIRQHEDWISRMQEYCNMSEEDREQAIKKERYNVELGNMLDKLEPYFSLFMQ